MKKTIIYTLVLLFTSTLLNAQENWIRFKDYPTDLVINIEEDSNIQDTPFVFINREDQAFNYVIPVKLESEQYESIANMEIKFTNIAASYDHKDRLMVYVRGKIDMSCCYPSPITLEFYDSKGNLVQIAKTDKSGNFKIKSINGNMVEISKGRIKFNFSRIMSFDGNADIRNANVIVYKKLIDEQFNSTQQATVINAQK
ncbi:MAG: hypothetical protein HKO81_04055 [Flavobacteriaceae bacterium]|nr:hypothetical protein [Bacteroidia bacterium]NNL15799.1 hypothetical protein [Flavobacteriaceae bacterium]